MKRIYGIIVFFLLLSIPQEPNKATTQDLRDGDVLFSFEIAYDPGSLQYGIPRNLTEGIAFDGMHICALIWMIESEYPKEVFSFEIRKFDPLDGSLVSTVEIFKEIPRIGIPSVIPHIDWDGSNFWISMAWEGPDIRGIFKIAQNTGEILKHFPIPFVDLPGALAFDGENMWVAGRAMGNMMYLVNLTDGSLISGLQPPTSTVSGLAFDGKFLWTTNTEKSIFKVDPNTSSVVSLIAGPNYENSFALTFDGEYLWVQTASDYTKDEKTGIEMLIKSVHKVYIDHTGPSASLVSHHEGEAVAGTHRVDFEIEDSAGVAKVEIRIEGVHQSWIDITSNYDVDQARYYFTWDTTKTDDGEHTISIRTKDTLENVATATYRLIVDNTGPVLSFVTPKEGESVLGMVRLAVRAEDTSNISLIELRVEGAQEGWINITTNFDPTEVYYYYEWNTSQISNGPYAITVRARDGLGNEGTSTLHLTVKNPDFVLPAVTFISHEEGVSVSGTVRIQINATDDQGIAKVELQIESPQDGWIDITANYDPIGTFYYYYWDTTEVANGAHTLTIRVTDTSGNQALNIHHLNVDNPAALQDFLLYFLAIGIGLVLLIVGFTYWKKQRRRLPAALQVRAQEELAGLLKTANDKLLIFKDIATEYKMPVDLVRDTVSNLESGGMLWGVASDKVFVSVDFALRTLKKLATSYDRLSWKKLMDEFGLKRVEDLQALLFQVSLLGEIGIKMDEVEKSIRITEVEEVVELKPRKLVCPTCGATLEPRVSRCANCGEEFPRCVVCNLPVLENLTKTPCCGVYAHAPHLQEWLKIKATCPICRERLQEWEVP